MHSKTCRAAACVLLFCALGYGNVQAESLTFTNLLEAGHSSAVVIDGDIMYAGLGYYLMVIDVQDRSDPQRLTSVRFDKYPRHLDLYGSHLIIEYEAEGLRIFDVSDPTNPVEVSSYTNSKVRDVAVSGTNAVLAMYPDGLQILDITDPANPTELGSVSTPDGAYLVEVEGTHAYLIGFPYGSLMVVDISDPANPAYVTSLSGHGYWNGRFEIQNGLAYLPRNNGMSIVDVSTPQTPVAIGVYTPPFWKEFEAVAVSGAYAYLLENYSDIDVVDVSDPTAPVGVATMVDEGGVDIEFDAGYLYTADIASSFRIVDITDPLNPLIAGKYQAIHYGRCLTTARDLAYVGEQVHLQTGGIWVIDLAQPDNPDFVSYMYSNYRVTEIDIHESRLVAGLQDPTWDSPTSGIRAYDLIDPTNPSYLSSMWGYDYVGDVESDDDYVYALGELGHVGFFIYDVQNPNSPVLVADVPMSWAFSIDVVGDVAFIAGQANGLLLYDVSDRSNPAQVTTFGAIDYIRDVEVENQIAYLASDSGLIVVDVSDSSQPTEIARLQAVGQPHDIALSYPYVFTSAYDDPLLRAVDVTDPNNPVIVADYETGGTSGPVAFMPPHVAVLTNVRGSLLILETDFLSPDPTAIPESAGGTALYQNHPNPFNPSTVIPFSLDREQHVRLAIYDVAGRQVVSIVNREMASGMHFERWSGENEQGRTVPSGVYFYRLTTRDFEQTRKMVFLK